MTLSPQLLAVVTKSKTVVGNLSLRAVKDGRQKPVQMVLESAGFVPDDIIVIILKEEYDRLKKADEEWDSCLEVFRNPPPVEGYPYPIDEGTLF